MEVLAAISVPQVLKFAYDALWFAWEQYENVQGNQAQCHLLIQRCQDLFIEVSTQISNLGPEGMEMHGQRMAAHLQSLDGACVTVKTTIRRLADKGFAWRLLHQDKINEELAAAETAIGDALTMFNLGTHLSSHKLQVEIASAQKADQRELVARLDSLANNDRKILAALQVDTRGRRRLEELILALDKHVKGITLPAVRNDPAEAFLLTASSALQRMSGQPAPEIPHWAVTGLEVSFDADDEESCIGKGGFGNIYKGEWNGQVVAVKEMHGEDARLLDRANLKYIRHEIMIWSRIAHPHLLPFYCACLEATRPFIVTRFCPNGNVLEYLRQHSKADRVVLLHEVSLGMTYLHSQGIIHADLKGSNVLVGDDQKALITDFGLSRLQDQIASATTGTKKVSGTLRWMAPELLDGEPLDKPADVYSFALLAWELYTGLVPFGDFPERALVRRVVDKRERPTRPTSMEDAMWVFVQQWWVHEASQRPVFGTIQMQLRGILLKAAVSSPVNTTYSVLQNANPSSSTISSDAPSALFESPNKSADTAWTTTPNASKGSQYFDPSVPPRATTYIADPQLPVPGAFEEPPLEVLNSNAWYPVAVPKGPLPASSSKERPVVPRKTENAWQIDGRAAEVTVNPRSILKNRGPDSSTAYPFAKTTTKDRPNGDRTSPKESTARLHVHHDNLEDTRACDMLCVAIDDQWVTVGLTSSDILVYNAITGAFHTVLKGHKSGVWDVELASWDNMRYSGIVGGTNSILLSGGTDQNIRVWDVETGICLRSLQGHTATIRSIKALPGRPRAVSGGRDRAAFVWDVKDGVCLHKLSGHMDAIRSVAVSGLTAVTASYDSTCRVWDTDYGICRHVLCGHIGRVYCVAINGTRIVSGGDDKTVRVWDAESGDGQIIISEHSGLVGQLQLSPTHLVSAGTDGLLIVYTFKTSTVHAIKAHDSSVVSLQLDSPYIISGSTDGTVKMWDLLSGKYVRNIGRPGEPSKSPWKFAGGRARSNTWVISSEVKGHAVIHIWTK